MVFDEVLVVKPLDGGDLAEARVMVVPLYSIRSAQEVIDHLDRVRAGHSA